MTFFMPDESGYAASAKKRDKLSHFMCQNTSIRFDQIQLAQFVEIEPAGIDCHADGAMDVEGGERRHVGEGGDSASGGQFVVCTSTKTAEPLEVGALEHAFFIYIGAQKSRAVGLKLCDDLNRSELGRFAPAFDDDAAVFAIERNDDTLGADGCGQFFKKTRNGKSGRSHNDAICALLKELPRARDRAHAAAGAHDGVSGKIFHQLDV